MSSFATISEWMITGLYFATAFVCAAAWQTTRGAAHDQSRSSHPELWATLTVVMLMLAANKQIDLQTVLIDAARRHAEDAGWYEHRRIMQAVSVLVVIALVSIAGWLLVRSTGKDWRRQRLLLTGVGMLAVFLLIRAADIQRINEMAGMPLLTGWALVVWESAALIATGVAAWRCAAVVP